MRSDQTFLHKILTSFLPLNLWDEAPPDTLEWLLN